MATKLVEFKDGTRIVRTVTRVVTQVPNRGAIVVTLSEEGIVFRYPKKQTRYVLPYGLGMHRAEQLAALALANKKAAEREARKRGELPPKRRAPRTLSMRGR